VKLSVLYRGSLTSCNYACRYCPFAKRAESRAALERDRASLTGFAAWITRESSIAWSIVFTPWGEALVRQWYRDVITRLSRLPHVESVGAQTNLSCGLGWIEECDPGRLVLWATYHPGEADLEAFLARVTRLRERGVRLSVGMVGVPDHFDEIATLRRRLPPDVYLWINAQRPRPRPYREEETAWLTSIDPQFPLSLRRERSLGRLCRAGESSFTVDARGDMRRCHFVDHVIGNIHDPQWRSAFQQRRCPNRFCDCFLGTSQLNADSLAATFGKNTLHRITGTARSTHDDADALRSGPGHSPASAPSSPDGNC